MAIPMPIPMGVVPSPELAWLFLWLFGVVPLRSYQLFLGYAYAKSYANSCVWCVDVSGCVCLCVNVWVCVLSHQDPPGALRVAILRCFSRRHLAFRVDTFFCFFVGTLSRRDLVDYYRYDCAERTLRISRSCGDGLQISMRICPLLFSVVFSLAWRCHFPLFFTLAPEPVHLSPM